MILLIRDKVRSSLSSGEVLESFDCCTDVYIHVGNSLVDISATCGHFGFVFLNKKLWSDTEDLFRLLI